MDKIIDIDDRVPTRRRKRKIRTNLKFGLLITIFLLCIGCLLYFQSPYSKLQTLTISGANLIDDEQYEALLGIKLEHSMWDIHTTQLESKMEKHEFIRSIEIEKKWLTTVHVHIEEWPKVAYLMRDFKFYPMLENGYILEDAQEDEPIDAPVFIQFDDENLRKKIVKQLGKINPEVVALISQIKSSPTKSDPYAITLFMNDGYEVRAEISSFAQKLNYYPSIVAQIEQSEQFEKGIIDIEVGSFYRPYSGEYKDAATLELKLEDEGNEEGEGDGE